MAQTGIERNPAGMSAHQIRTEEFMKQGGQVPPSRATMPDEDTRELRARLIMEEALETIQALGCTLCVRGEEAFNFKTDVRIRSEHPPDFEGIVDGCADLMVVTTGTGFLADGDRIRIVAAPAKAAATTAATTPATAAGSPMR